MKSALLFTALLGVSPASRGAGSDIEKTTAGPAASTGAVDGFSAKVVVTPDKNWQEKWATPEGDIPSFTTAESVEEGNTITVLTFFSNPTPGADGKVHVRCDLKMVKPGGVVGTDMKDVLCFPEVTLPRPKNVQLSSLAVMFQAEPSDPKGNWLAEIVVRDTVSKREIPLKAAFQVK